ncbi:TniQ family protein [Rummeliibacillus suwonensis]|nr:TnsD family Tn7-like transposition protein [Rummeliibacillus suwonensis]MBO2537210.1 TniQ family protein [Rummeliibacillus suwonensis]
MENHTIFPLISPFLSYQRKQDFQQSLMIKNSLKNKKIFMDYIAKEIKYCPKCLKDDYEKYGEVYSHRLHQLYFLDYCNKHQTKLIYVCPECGVPLSNNDGKELLTRPFCKNGHSLTSNTIYLKDYPKPIKRIIQDIHFFISHSSNINKDLILERFYSELGKRGYGENYSEYIQIKRLKKDFSNYLRTLEVQQDNVIDSQFNTLLTKRSNDAPNLLAYLLLFQFISDSSEDFFSNTVGYSIDIPFKNEQQPCLNKICKYYNKRIIRTYTKRYYPVLNYSQPHHKLWI